MNQRKTLLQTCVRTNPRMDPGYRPTWSEMLRKHKIAWYTVARAPNHRSRHTSAPVTPTTSARTLLKHSHQSITLSVERRLNRPRPPKQENRHSLSVKNLLA